MRVQVPPWALIGKSAKADTRQTQLFTGFSGSAFLSSFKGELSSNVWGTFRGACVGTPPIVAANLAP